MGWLMIYYISLKMAGCLAPTYGQPRSCWSQPQRACSQRARSQRAHQKSGGQQHWWLPGVDLCGRFCGILYTVFLCLSPFFTGSWGLPWAQLEFHVWRVEGFLGLTGRWGALGEDQTVQGEGHPETLTSDWRNLHHITRCWRMEKNFSKILRRSSAIAGLGWIYQDFVFKR